MGAHSDLTQIQDTTETGRSLADILAEYGPVAAGGRRRRVTDPDETVEIRFGDIPLPRA